MSKKLMVSIDLSTLMYKAYYGKSDKYIQEKIVYRVIKWIMSIIEIQNPDFIAICLDENNRSKLYRRKLMPEYKSNRGEKPIDILKAEEKIIEFCRIMSIKCVRINGAEADDVIASVNKLCNDNRIYNVLLTSDGDMASLFGKYTRIAKPTRDSIKILRSWSDVRGNFKKIITEHPHQVREALSLTSDKSDNIEGLKGYGKVRASKIIDKYGDLKNIYNNLDDFDEKTRKLFEENRERLFFNRKMIKLYDKFNVGDIADYAYNFNYDLALGFLEKYGLENKLYSKLSKISFDLDF